MKSSIIGKLDTVLDSHARREEENESKARDAERQRKEFQAAFESVAEKIIKPSLDEVAQYLLGKGQRSHVSIDLVEIQSSRGSHSPNVTIRLLFEGDHQYRSRGDTAQLAFQADKVRKSINIQENTIRPRGGGHAGSVGTVGVDSVTTDLVQEKAAEWLEKVFR